jgi:hypothetical protein
MDSLRRIVWIWTVDPGVIGIVIKATDNVEESSVLEDTIEFTENRERACINCKSVIEESNPWRGSVIQ